MCVGKPYIDPTGFACTIATCWWKTNQTTFGKHRGATLTWNITRIDSPNTSEPSTSIAFEKLYIYICPLPKSPEKKSVPLQVVFSCFNPKKNSQQKSSPPSSPPKKTEAANHHHGLRRLLFYRQRQLPRGRLGGGDEAFPNLRTGQIDGHHMSAQGLDKCSGGDAIEPETSMTIQLL